MTSFAIVSEKGQVTLPKRMRDELGILPGSRLEFRVASDRTLQVVVLSTGAGSLFGLLAKPGEATRSLGDMDAAITQTVKRRARRSA